MSIRRIGGFIIALTMLQAGVVQGGLCETQAPTSDVAAHHATPHHGQPASDLADQRPERDEGRQTNCCPAMAACGLVFVEPDALAAGDVVLVHLLAAAPATTRLVSVTTAPEPPPPRA